MEEPSFSAYNRLRQLLDQLPGELRTPLAGFGDMDTEQVADCTELPPQEAALARQREHTEPGLWRGDEAGQGAFMAAHERQ